MLAMGGYFPFGGNLLSVRVNFFLYSFVCNSCHAWEDSSDYPVPNSGRAV